MAEEEAPAVEQQQEAGPQEPVQEEAPPVAEGAEGGGDEEGNGSNKRKYEEAPAAEGEEEGHMHKKASFTNGSEETAASGDQVLLCEVLLSRRDGCACSWENWAGGLGRTTILALEPLFTRHSGARRKECVSFLFVLLVALLPLIFAFSVPFTLGIFLFA
jgi:hypothetical protein